MHTATLYTAGAFAAGLALTWSLCAWLTPHSWWRRPNLRALGLSAAGAWGFGSLILAAVPVVTLPVTALPAMPLSELALPMAGLPVAAAPVPVSPVAAASTVRQRSASTAPTSGMAAGPSSARRGAETGVREPGRPFQVHRDLNLRASAGVDAPRLLTVPAGATVLATGHRHGDWWQVTARVNGQQSTGWASSLWLRRSDETARPE